MRLIATRTEGPALGRARLVGTVTYDDRPTATQEYWFRTRCFPSPSRRGRADLRFAADQVMKLSRWIRRALRLPDSLGRRRGIFRSARPIHRALLVGEMV